MTAVDEEVVEEKAARLRVPEVLRVLLVELESKIKRLEYEKGVLLARRQGTALPPLPAQASGAGKRVRSDAAERSGKRSHHGPRS